MSRLNQHILKKVLEIATEKIYGFEEKDILPLFHNTEYDLVIHLDYLSEKRFIIGEFTSESYVSFAIFPKPIDFIRGKITQRGIKYLAKLKEQEEAAVKE